VEVTDTTITDREDTSTSKRNSTAVSVKNVVLAWGRWRAVVALLTA